MLSGLNFFQHVQPPELQPHILKNEKGLPATQHYLRFVRERVNNAGFHSVGRVPLFGWVRKALLELFPFGIGRCLTPRFDFRKIIT